MIAAGMRKGAKVGRMMRTGLAATMVGVLTVTAAAAQQKPNFSGRWVIVSPAEGAGQEQIVKHDEKTLSTAHASEGAGHSMLYQLDGATHRNAIPSHGSEIVILSTARWDGNRIVITSAASYPNGRKTESKEIWSLDDQGRLVIDFTETVDGKPGQTFKVIHTKKG